MGTRKLMRGADAVWLRLDQSVNPTEVVAMLVFEERLSRDRFRELIEERLLRFVRLRSRVVRWKGRFAWEVEREFSIDRHLRWHRLGDGAIETKLHELAAAPLDPAHPLWRFDVVDLPDHSVLIAKVHHSLGDGFAQIALLLALVDEELPIDKRPKPRDRGRLRIGRMLRTSFKLTALPRDPATGLKRRLSGPQRFAWTKGVSLEAVRAEAHRRGVKINDLLIAILTSALAETIGPSDVRAVVPVNLRGPGSEPLGNRFGLVFLPLPLHEPSLDESAHLVSRAMRRLKQRHEAVAAAALLGVLGLLPKWLACWGARFFARKASLVVTNVPGPQEALHVGGNRLAHVHFWVPHPATLGLGVSILSYAGEVRMGVRADAAVLPDPTRLVRCIERELEHVLSPSVRSMPGDWKEGAPSWNA